MRLLRNGSYAFISQYESINYYCNKGNEVSIGRLELITLLMGMLLTAGCSEAEPPAAMVSGTVTLNGEPFTGAAVHFYNPEVGGGAFNLNESGHFVSVHPLRIAEYMVSLDRPGPTPGDSPADIVWASDNSSKVPLKYRSSGKSGLVARVVEGTENKFSFDMQGESTDEKAVEGPAVILPLPGFGN